MQKWSCEMLGWMKHRLESRLQGETSTISDMQMYQPNGRKQRLTEESLDEGEREEWKPSLQLNVQKTKITAVMKLKDSGFLGGKLKHT